MKHQYKLIPEIPIPVSRYLIFVGILFCGLVYEKFKNNDKQHLLNLVGVVNQTLEKQYALLLAMEVISDPLLLKKYEKHNQNIHQKKKLFHSNEDVLVGFIN
jgi:hypothetical protein